MSEQIFSQKEVGEYFNAHFINVAMRMDKTAKDTARSRTGMPMPPHPKEFSIEIYPTYLFFARMAGRASAIGAN